MLPPCRRAAAPNGGDKHLPKGARAVDQYTETAFWGITYNETEWKTYDTDKRYLGL